MFSKQEALATPLLNYLPTGANQAGFHGHNNIRCVHTTCICQFMLFFSLFVITKPYPDSIKEIFADSYSCKTLDVFATHISPIFVKTQFM
jgi:hypothetical protein